MTEKTNEVYEKVHTSCADCIFAEYDEKTQTGCSFDRVEKFRSSGCEVVDAEDTPAETDTPTDTGGIMGNLEAAIEKARELGDEKLIDQIGNTITFYTRQYISK